MCIRSLLFSTLILGSFALQASPQLDGIANEIDAGTGELRINIRGQGFGSGPDVLFFHDFRSMDNGTALKDTNPEVGEMSFGADNPKVGTHLNQKGFWVVNEERNKETILRARLGASYEDVFIAYSLAIPEGRTAPDQTEPEKWGGSAAKFAWLLEQDGSSGDADEFDLIMPAQNSDIATLHGNASQFRREGSGAAMTIARMSDWWAWDEFNHVTGWVKANKEDARKSTGNFSSVNKEFGFRNFDTSSNLELVGPPPKVSVVNFPGWFRVTEEDNFQALYSNLYVAGGQNMWARIELTDSADYTESAYRKVLLPSSWSEESIKTSINLDVFRHKGPLYVHVFNADGERSSSGLLACQKCPVMN